MVSKKCKQCTDWERLNSPDGGYCFDRDAVDSYKTHTKPDHECDAEFDMIEVYEICISPPEYLIKQGELEWAMIYDKRLAVDVAKQMNLDYNGIQDCDVVVIDE